MITINLLASEHRRARMAPAGTRLWLAATAGITGVLVVWSLALAHRTAQLQNQVDDAVRQAMPLRTVAAQVAQLSQAAVALQARQAVLQQLLGTQMPAAEALQSVEAVIPGTVWVTSMTVTGGAQVAFDGYAFSYPDIARFMVQLGASGSFQGVDLNSGTEESIGNRDVVHFEVTGALSAHPVMSQRKVAP